jgi:hypothetical protein
MTLATVYINKTTTIMRPVLTDEKGRAYVKAAGGRVYVERLTDTVYKIMRGAGDDRGGSR